MTVTALSEVGRRMRIVVLCAAAVAMIVPSSARASHESVQGRVGSLGYLGGQCGSHPSCVSFLAANCPGENALYKDDHHPFISVKNVAPFTAKDRTAVLRLTATQSPAPGNHNLVVANIKTCNREDPPTDLEGGPLAVGGSVTVKIPKGTRWVAVWLLSPGLMDQWKLTFNHLP